RKFRGHTAKIWAVAPSPDGRLLVSGSGDQTVRVWDPEREDPLLSLFVAGDDWVAWTPEGYYAASPGGERLMGWHVSNGPAALGSFRPAADFHDSLYNPELIKLLLQTGSVKRALEVLGQRLVKVEEVLPPAVFITSPDRSGIKLDGPELTVRAVARGRPGQPVTALRLLIGGRPHEGDKGRKAIGRERAESGDVREEWAIRLDPGRHKLAVQAESKVSKGLSSPVEVVYDAPRIARPNLYVLAIGVSAYPG